MDPLTMTAASSAVGAAGNLLGGLTADTTLASGDMTYASRDPMQDAYMGRYLFDAALPLGMADAQEIPSVGQSIANRISAVPFEERVKRRALIAWGAVIDNPGVPVDDVLNSLNVGATPDELREALQQALGRVGHSLQDIPQLQQREVQHRELVSQLQQRQGEGVETVGQRMDIARNVNEMLYGASQFASGQGEMSPLTNANLSRLNRITNEQEEQALLRNANLGMRPGDIAMQFAQQRQENPLTALGQTLGIAGAIQNLYTQQQAGMQNALGLAVPAQSSALNTAANQASTANQLAAQGKQAEADMQANAISGAFGNIASGLNTAANYGMAQELMGSRAPTAFEPLQNPSGAPLGSINLPGGGTGYMQFTTPYIPGGSP